MSDHKAQIIRVDLGNDEATILPTSTNPSLSIKKVSPTQIKSINDTLNNILNNDTAFSNNFLPKEITDIDNYIFDLVQNIDHYTRKSQINQTYKNVKDKNKNNNKPWITTAIIDQIKKRDKIFKRFRKQPFNKNLEIHYKNLRDRVHKIIKQEKTKYYNNLILCSNTHKRDIWLNINNILHRKNKQHNQNAITEISINNKIIKDNRLISIAFKDYYKQNNFSNIDPPDDDYDNFVLENNKISIDPVLVRTLFNQNFSKIKNDNRIDNMYICPLIIKNNNYIKERLYKIFFFSLKNCYYPNIIAKAITIPIHKKGIKNNIENYRPITISNTISKLFEGIIFDLCDRFSENNNTLHVNQC